MTAWMALLVGVCGIRNKRYRVPLNLIGPMRTIVIRSIAWMLTRLKPDLSLKVGSAHAFGKPVTILGAPSQVSLRAGKLELGKPVVNYVPEKQPSGRAGILGLAAFEGHVVVLDLIRGRLGRSGPCASATSR